MLNNNIDPNASTSRHRSSSPEDDPEEEEQIIREIHALTPQPQPQPQPHTRARSSSLSMASTTSSENFTSMSREFSALVIAGSTIDPINLSPMNEAGNNNNNNNNLGRIREDDLLMEETNPLAIVPDNSPLLELPARGDARGVDQEQVSVQRVKKEEVDAKILAWQNAKVAKINNRFKREDAVIHGWENEQVQKATSWMKKVERKLEDKRARALEKTQNKVAKAHRKAEERRASAEAKRGTKVARILEICSLMRAVGRPPAKKSFF